MLKLIKIIAILFYVLSGILLASAANLMVPAVQRGETGGFFIGLLAPAVACLCIGLFAHKFSNNKTRKLASSK